MKSLFCLCVALALTAVWAQQVTYPSVWPQPASWNSYGGTNTSSLSIGADFTISCNRNAVCNDVINSAITRYTSMIFFAGTPSLAIGQFNNLTITISDETPLSIFMDRSYTLTVDEYTAEITANNAYGALYGLETFSQLIRWQYGADGVTNEYYLDGQFSVITDSPRFAWRGLLIDSSRHFLTVNSILRTIDAMSYNKLNVLHWHFVDDDSWPIESQTYPSFSAAGAYSSRQVYHPNDVKLILQYAADRGIQVLPEFDMPAHSDIWAKGMPEIVESCTGHQSLIDPTGSAYPIITGLLKEFAIPFGTGFVHLGGDEVESFACWNKSAKVQGFMKQQGYKTMAQVRNYFQESIQNISTSLELTPIFWEEVFDGNYTIYPNTIVNVWLGNSETAKIVAQGLRVINSFGWYLDQQIPAGDQHYLWLDTWKNFYTNDPVDPKWPASQQALILGGEASMWGEQVDSLVIDERIWPRASATAEALWTPVALKNVTAAAPRLEKFRCDMTRRGIAASPIRPGDTYMNCELPPTSRLYDL